MEEKDLVIGFVKNYGPHHVHNWVFSLKRSGYVGDIVLVDYTPNDEMWNFCHQNNVRYMEHSEPPSPSRNICVDRFLALHLILTDSMKFGVNYRYVITTDVRDVIFQKNPIDYLLRLNGDYDDREMVFSTEGITYENEPWSYNNMRLSFGNDALSMMKNYPIINAGVIAGRHEPLTKLCLSIYLMCVGRPAFISGGGGPDQSALNILIRTLDTESLRLSNECPWVAQIGTMLDPSKDFSKVRIDNGIDFDSEGYVSTVYGERFHVVHQYDRNPELKNLIDERYAIG